MSVSKRGSFYWMVFMFNGRRIQKTTKCKNRRDAEEVERAYRTQLAKGEVGFEEKKKVPCFKDAMKEFLKFAEGENQSSKNTVRRATTSSKALLRFFENKQIDLITVEDVEKFKESRKRQKKQAPNKKLKKNAKATTTTIIKPATVNRELACLRAMLNYYIRKDYFVKNPVSKVKFLKEDNEQMRVVSLTEEKIYLNECSQPLKDVATIMIETGMRPSEVFQLNWKDINLERGFVFIQQGKTKAARRKIPLSDRAY